MPRLDSTRLDFSPLTSYRYEATLRGLWAEITVKRGPAKRLLTFEAYLKLMRRIELITTDLTERDVAFSFRSASQP